MWFGLQRLLNFSGNPQVVVDARFFRLLAVKPGALDGQGSFSRKSFESRSRPFGLQNAPFLSVEIEDANWRFCGNPRSARFAVDKAQRDAGDVADAKSNRAHMSASKVRLEQVIKKSALTTREHFPRNLAAGGECPTGQRHTAAAPRDFEFQLVPRGRKHDETPVGVGRFERRVQHHGENLVQNLSRAEHAEAIEYRRDLPQIGSTRNAAPERLLIAGQEKDQLDRVATPETDSVAVCEAPLRNRFSVYRNAMPRATVAQNVGVVGLPDFCMIAGHVGADDLKIARTTAPDREDRLVDGHNPAAQRVGDLKARVGHDVYCDSSWTVFTGQQCNLNHPCCPRPVETSTKRLRLVQVAPCC